MIHRTGSSAPSGRGGRVPWTARHEHPSPRSNRTESSRILSAPIVIPIPAGIGRSTFGGLGVSDIGSVRSSLSSSGPATVGPANLEVATTDAVTITATAATWEIALVALLFVMIVALFALRLSEVFSVSSSGERARSSPSSMGTGESGVGGSNTTSAADQSMMPIHASVPPESLSDDDRVLQLLAENDGRLRQQVIVERTEWSKSKVSRLLSKMEERGTIEKVPIGRENIIRLSTPSSSSPSEYPPATTSSDDHG